MAINLQNPCSCCNLTLNVSRNSQFLIETGYIFTSSCIVAAAVTILDDKTGSRYILFGDNYQPK